MQSFDTALYEAVLVAFGKVIGRYDGFTQSRILREVGAEILEYLGRHGYPFEERGDVTDLKALTDLFVRNGFAERVDSEPATPGETTTWYGLHGFDAYKELLDVAANPFLSCPLNLCLYHVAAKHGKTLKLHRKAFDTTTRVVEAQYELVDDDDVPPGDADPLVIENARLCRLAQERADRLEKAQQEIKMLRGIIPICASCKRVRDDAGYWQQVEQYVSEHSDAVFTHGLCPTCAQASFEGL
jgi:hypothetical protein